MKRIIALLLACLTLVQMLPLGIHSHAQETEETEAIVAETTEVFETEEITYPLEPSVAETTEATLPPETTAVTAPVETEETAPVETTGEIVFEESMVDQILSAEAEEEEEEILLPDEFGWIESELAAGAVYDESEPNGTIYDARLIKHEYIVRGYLSGEDVDIFAFRLDYKSDVALLAVAKKSSFILSLWNSDQKVITADKKGTKTDDGNYSYVIEKTLKAGTYYMVLIDGKKNYTEYATEVLIYPKYETCKHGSKKKVETVEPTCGTQGYTEYYCKTCEYTWKDNYVAATGNHVYDDDFDSYCNVCNKYRSVGIASGTCGDNLRWRISDYGVLIIGGTGPMYDYIVDYGGSGSKAPWNSYRDDITSVVIEHGATRIGNAAFYNLKQVTSISIPDSVSSIGNSAFFYCQKLSGIVIPEGVQAIERSAFNSCDALTSITLPQSLTSIGTLAFFGCHLLKEITFPEGLQSIGSEAFSYCNKLTTVTIPKNVSSIGSDAFESCDILRAIWVDAENGYYSSDSLGNLYDKDKTVLICVPENLAGFVDIPDTVTRIDATFYYRQRVTGVTIPEGITSIPDEFFAWCEDLASVTLPSTLTSIGAEAFMFCRPITSLTIPEEVTSIGTKAFYCCSGLQSVTFAGKAPTIGEDAFYQVASDVFYQAGDTTWTTSKRQNYGGTLNWIAKCISGHVEVIDVPGVAPTCLEEGLSPDAHCSNCGEITSVQRVLPALGHDVVVDAYLAPTCLDTGLTEGKHCGRCNEVLLAQKVIPALGHTTVVDAYLAPRCEETGLTEGSHCGRCDLVFVAQNVIPALGHRYTNHWCDHCGRAEFVEVISIEADALTIGSGEQANLTAILDYPIRKETELVWTLAEGDDAYATLEPGRETAVLTAKRLLQDTTVTVSAKTVDGLHEPVSIQITIKGVEADHRLFAGKSVTFKPVNPATNKAYTAKQLVWTLEEAYEPYVTVKNGKVTARKVVEKVRVQVIATVVATGKQIPYVIDIYPAVTQLEVKHEDAVVNGKTVLMDYSRETIVLNAGLFPSDLEETVTWTVSDKKQQYANYTIDGNTLTITGPKGKSGTVTVKATVDAGVKKTATVKLQFGSFAREITIFEPAKTTIRGGETLALSAYISDPVVVSKPGLVWTVSDKTAATVSGGKVKAKNVAHPTTVTVTATSKDGQASASIDLAIIPKNEGQLVLAWGKQYLSGTKAMNFGDTLQLTSCTVHNGEATPVDAIWTSSNSSVAHVAGGLITATGVGTAKITAECGVQKVVLTVKVDTLVGDMEITTKDGKNVIEENGEKVILLASGKSVNLVAKILTQGASNAVTWEIVDGGEVAKIASSGKITANKDLTGVTYVTVKATAKDGSGTAKTAKVKVLPLATGLQIYQNGTRVRTNTALVVDMMATPTLKLSARVYPAKANQSVELTSSGKKVADFVNGELVCYKPGTVTITAKALDGSNAKATFKLTIVKRVVSLSLAPNVPVDANGNLFLAGGKSLNLTTVVQISPSDATNKKLTWKVAPNPYGVTVSSSGVLKTKAVKAPVTVNVMAMTQDGSGLMLSFNVLIYPA